MNAKEFKNKFSDNISPEVKKLFSEFFLNIKFILLNSSFKTLKDVNANTHDLFDNLIDIENKKLIEKVGEKTETKEIRRIS